MFLLRDFTNNFRSYTKFFLDFQLIFVYGVKWAQLHCLHVDIQFFQ
jgi:hypothetical protein